MIDILYSGYSYTHEHGVRFDTDTENGRAAQECYLLVFAHDPANFLAGGEYRSYPAETMVLFTPGTRKSYFSAPGVPYSNDWIHFNTDEQFIRKFPMNNVPFTPSDPDYIHNIIRLICWEDNEDHSPNNPNMRDLFHLLFGKISKDMAAGEATPYRQELLKIRREIMLHPEISWNVPDMAERLSISTAHLHYLYKNAFGISCMDDVIQNRIKLAKDKLIYSTDTIGAIAEQCGYTNTEHFCRQFRKITGTTPRQFRVSSTDK
ncbi:MAG: helix-turn-helix transcriptional regulator [Clostridiales bacterium]|nr:helix-turn-helix transcriptional regulator [Clostridiales bacterium]